MSERRNQSRDDRRKDEASSEKPCVAGPRLGEHQLPFSAMGRLYSHSVRVTHSRPCSYGVGKIRLESGRLM